MNTVQCSLSRKSDISRIYRAVCINLAAGREKAGSLAFVTDVDYTTRLVSFTFLGENNTALCDGDTINIPPIDGIASEGP